MSISGPGVTTVTPPAAGPDDPQPGRLPGGRVPIVKRKVTLRVGSSVAVAGAGAATSVGTPLVANDLVV